jgi:hypothetical protein
MSGIQSTDLRSAAEKQIELWNKSRDVVEEYGDDVTARTDPPVIAADETIASHAYDEAKAERERRGNDGRPAHVQNVATVNDAANDALPGESLGSNADAWEDIADRGEGIYRGIHPTMERDDVYIYGCPHYLVFDDGRPARVIRLRGTKYVDRPEPYASQMIGPWVTCRILERSRFDVSDLQFTIIRYDRREYTGVKQVSRLSIIHHGYASGEEVEGVDVAEAVEGYNDLQANTYEYTSRFSHDSVDFADRLQRSIEILRGNRNPLGDLNEV